jgi:hypothetical protein
MYKSCDKKQGVTQIRVANCVTPSRKLRSRAKKGTKKALKNSVFQCFFVRVFITDLILRHSAEVVETYSQSTENACVYKEFGNTKGI